MFRIILSFSTLLFYSYQLCISKTDLAELNETQDSYCLSIIQWPISETTLSDYESLDNLALLRYQNHYQNYYLNSTVDIDCLGVMKYFFCATAYPVCTDEDEQISKVCNWLCFLVDVRCASSKTNWEQFCLEDNTNDYDCSFGQWPLWSLSLILILIFAIW